MTALSDTTTRLLTFISDSCFNESKWLIRNRADAADKSRKYEWRLSSDKAAARGEAHIQKMGAMMMRNLGIEGY